MNSFLAGVACEIMKASVALWQAVFPDNKKAPKG